MAKNLAEWYRGEPSEESKAKAQYGNPKPSSTGATRTDAKVLSKLRDGVNGVDPKLTPPAFTDFMPKNKYGAAALDVAAIPITAQSAFGAGFLGEGAPSSLTPFYDYAKGNRKPALEANWVQKMGAATSDVAGLIPRGLQQAGHWIDPEEVPSVKSFTPAYDAIRQYRRGAGQTSPATQQPAKAAAPQEAIAPDQWQVLPSWGRDAAPTGPAAIPDRINVPARAWSPDFNAEQMDAVNAHIRKRGGKREFTDADAAPFATPARQQRAPTYQEMVLHILATAPAKHAPAAIQALTQGYNIDEQGKRQAAINESVERRYKTTAQETARGRRMTDASNRLAELQQLHVLGSDPKTGMPLRPEQKAAVKDAYEAELAAYEDYLMQLTGSDGVEQNADGGEVGWLHKFFYGEPKKQPQQPQQPQQPRPGAPNPGMLGDGTANRAGQAIQTRQQKLEEEVRRQTQGYADGGEVDYMDDEYAMPSEEAIDTTGAVASMETGDYVFPVEAVRYFGTKMLKDMVNKALTAE